MIKGVIFDFNGTLYDDAAIHIKVWSKIYEEITGSAEGYEEFRKHLIGGKNENIIKQMYEKAGKTITAEEIAKLSAYKEKAYRDYSIEHNTCHMINGAEAVMDYIKERMPMNLSSNSIDANIDFFFSEFGVGRWFDRKLVTNDDGVLSDKEEMYIKAAENIGLELKDCLIFDDSKHGCMSAYAGGCRNIILIDPKGKKIIYPGVIQTVRDFTEVDLSIFD